MSQFSYFLPFFLLFLRFSFASYAQYKVPSGLIQQALSEIKAFEQEKYSSRELIEREQDKEMMREIVKDFFKEKINKRVTFNELEENLKEKDLEKYIADWKQKMYLKLLELYKIEYDQPFLQEMLNDPDFYGLTFDAYQMMTFEIEPSKPEQVVKEEIHEEVEDKGPVFEYDEQILEEEKENPHKQNENEEIKERVDL